MWTGGVRVVVLDGEGKLLLVKQRHEGRDIWMLPGGAIEEGETSAEAAIREVKEETGLDIKVGRLIWHIEEVSGKRGQRFVNYFIAESVSGEAVLGSDPEFDKDSQFLKDIGFFGELEVKNIPLIYPELLRNELWKVLKRGYNTDIYMLRG
jgi:8-oxo-dGTP pyrophosphatase MutT (NUDIX family)